VKCKVCKTIYWLDDKNKIGERYCWSPSDEFYAKLFDRPDFAEFVETDECQKAHELMMEEEIKYQKARWVSEDRARLLSTTNDYQEAIDSMVYRNDEEHKFLRIWLWRAFNDNVRESKGAVLSENDQKIYNSNCRKLIELLDKNDIQENFMIAELYRNIENYDECRKILKTIESKDEVWVERVKILEAECSKQNPKVVEMKLLNYVYVVRCADGTLYTGWTNDLDQRIKTHNEGKGAKYTRSRLPVTLVYQEPYDYKKRLALKREIEIKKLTKAQKEKLIDLSTPTKMALANLQLLKRIHNDRDEETV